MKLALFLQFSHFQENTKKKNLKLSYLHAKTYQTTKCLAMSKMSANTSWFSEVLLEKSPLWSETRCGHSAKTFSQIKFWGKWSFDIEKLRKIILLLVQHLRLSQLWKCRLWSAGLWCYLVLSLVGDTNILLKLVNHHLRDYSPQIYYWLCYYIILLQKIYTWWKSPYLISLLIVQINCCCCCGEHFQFQCQWTFEQAETISEVRILRSTFSCYQWQSW